MSFLVRCGKGAAIAMAQAMGLPARKDAPWPEAPAGAAQIVTAPRATGARHGPSLVDRLLALIQATAGQGKPCPTNLELADALNVGSTVTVVNTIKRATQRGLVVVTRTGNSRVMAAPDGSWRTAEAGAGGGHSRESVQRVVALIRAAALAGRSCPTNRELATAMGWAAPNAAVVVVNRAEAQGLIRVERDATKRRVVAADGSWQTAPIAPPTRRAAASPRPRPQPRPPAASAPAVAPQPKPRPAPAAAPIDAAEEARPMVRAIPSARCCRWPMGEPGDAAFRYCDAPGVPAGKSYCAEHHAIAHRRPRQAA